jgi:hypothetical protein
VAGVKRETGARQCARSRFWPHLKRHLHKVGLDEAARLREAVAHARVVVQRARDLVRVVVDPCDVRPAEERNLAQRAADAAADVEHLAAGLEPELERQVVLVALDRLLVSLPREAVREMERGAPAFWVFFFGGGGGLGALVAGGVGSAFISKELLTERPLTILVKGGRQVVVLVDHIGVGLLALGHVAAKGRVVFLWERGGRWGVGCGGGGAGRG